MRNWWLTLLAAGSLLLAAACTPGETGNDSFPTESPTLLQEAEETPMFEETPMNQPTVEPTPETTPTDEVAGEEDHDRAERLIDATIPAGLERVPTPDAPIVGEVPNDLLSAVIADLKENQGIDEAVVELVRAESVVWRDGSLGCPQPGMMYTQALIPGYWVVLRHGELDYDYRLSENGTFFLCDSSPHGQTGGTAPTS